MIAGTVSKSRVSHVIEDCDEKQPGKIIPLILGIFERDACYNSAEYDVYNA